MLKEREVAGEWRNVEVGREVCFRVTGRGELRAGGRMEMRQRRIMPVVSEDDEAMRMSQPLELSRRGGL